MPIQLKLRDDLEEAVAAYKHYDVLLVNAMFDGMNLVAKEGPLVNERNGVSILSENTGAHEELGEFALSVNPFDVQELADSIHAALTMAPAERERRAEGLKRIVTARDPGDWIDEQLADIHKKGPVEAAERGRDDAAAARSLIDRYADGDVEAVLAGCHPQVEWHTRWPGLDPVYHGPAGVREWAERAQEPMKGLIATIERVEEAGPRRSS